MPMEAQTRLLRVLQQGEYTTVGGRVPIKTDVRIVAASNKDLRILIQQGLFREDLFFRLNVVPLRLPPLRERIEDLPDLIRHFFALAEKDGLPPKKLDTQALERLKQHRWPGNVRELENLARRLAALYPQDVITSSVIDGELAPPAVSGGGNASQTVDNLGGAVEAYTLLALLGLPQWRTAARPLSPHPEGDRDTAVDRSARGHARQPIRAADLLGLNRNTLRKKIRDLDIRALSKRELIRAIPKAGAGFGIDPCNRSCTCFPGSVLSDCVHTATVFRTQPRIIITLGSGVGAGAPWSSRADRHQLGVWA